MACRRSTSLLHLRNSVAQPVTSTANGRAMSSPQRPMRGRTANQVTICWAVCAGSYCGGWSAHEERSHEEGGWQDEKQFRGSDIVL